MPRGRGLTAVLAGASLLGFSAIFVRWAMAGGASALTVGLYRMLFALPGALLLAGRSGGLGGGRGRRWALAAGMAFSVDLALWHAAMRETTAANANSWGLGHVDAVTGALALQMQQVATLFLAAWLLAEPIRPLGLCGGACILGGIVLVAAGASPRRTGGAAVGALERG